MDTHQALEIVSKYMHTECGDKEIRRLRKRISKAHSANFRLRKKAQQLEKTLATERMYRRLLNEIVVHVFRQMDSVLETQTDQIAEQ